MAFPRREESKMRIATVDIGTNTVLLLVAEIDNQGRITPLAYEQRIPRLGKDVDANKVIGHSAIVRVSDVLQEYKVIAEKNGSHRIVAAGTSAVRDATNQEEFLAAIRSRTDMEVEVLSGEEEAVLSYQGALSGLRNNDPHESETLRRLAVLDIGGGSTEITIGDEFTLERQMSLNIGSVRLTERYLRHNPPLLSELTYAVEFVQFAFQHLGDIDLSDARVVGVAGTVTTLAALDQSMKEFDREKISGYSLSQKAVENLYYRLRAMKVEEILELSNATKDRADILVAGSLILHEFLQKTKATQLIVSERGLRYGLALREWRKETGMATVLPG